MSDRTLNRDLRARLVRPRWWDLVGRRRWRAVKSEPVACGFQWIASHDGATSSHHCAKNSGHAVAHHCSCNAVAFGSESVADAAVSDNLQRWESPR